MPEPSEWHKQALAALGAAGYDADLDVPDSVLLAGNRTLMAPGSTEDRLAESLAADLAGHAAEPVTRATCAALARAAADLKGLVALADIGAGPVDVLAVLGVAAAKLEMQAKP